MSDRNIAEIAAYYQARYGQMIRIARRYVPTSDCVYDVLQQVFIDFYRNVTEKEWDLRQDWTAHLCQMTKSRAIKTWQKRQRGERLAMRLLDEKMMSGCRRQEDVFADEENRDMLSEADEIASLRHCLALLPEHQFRLVNRYYLEKNVIEVVAEEAGKSVTATHQFLYRIRLKLRECIERFLRNKPP